MNKFLYGFLASLVVISMLGCSSILKNNEGVLGKSSKKAAEVDTKIRQTENMTAAANEARLVHIGAWSEGTQYSLEKIKTNTPPEVVVAKQINERVRALADKPDFKEAQEVKAIVDDLLSQIEKEKQAGAKALASKDKEIAKIQLSMQNLNNVREQEIANALAQSKANAAIADQYKATLSEMDAWGGLGAIKYGFSRLIKRLAWGLGIFTVLFIILRVLSLSNPMAASIFRIFSHIGSWFINIIEFIVPKAAQMAGHTATAVFNAYKSTLTKVVDAIQMAKERAEAAGKPADLNAVLDEVAKSMNTDEKAIVDELKKALNWK
jgi:hypothetical protein